MPILLFCEDELELFPAGLGLSSIASSRTMFIKLSNPRKVPETYLPLLRWRLIVLSRYDLYKLMPKYVILITKMKDKNNFPSYNLRFGPLEPILFSTVKSLLWF